MSMSSNVDVKHASFGSFGPQRVRDDPESLMRSILVPTVNDHIFVIESMKDGAKQYGMIGVGMPTPRSIADMKIDDLSILDQIAADMPHYKASLLATVKRFARGSERLTRTTDPIHYGHTGYAVVQTSDRGGLMVYDFCELTAEQATFLEGTSTVKFKLVKLAFKAIQAMYLADIEARKNHEQFCLHADLLNFGRMLNTLSTTIPLELDTSVHLPYLSVMDTIRHIHVAKAPLRMMFGLSQPSILMDDKVVGVTTAIVEEVAVSA